MTIKQIHPAPKPADNSDKITLAVCGALTAAVLGYFGLIVAHQNAYYDPTCGSVFAGSAEAYAACITETFAGSAETSEEALAAARAHLLSESFEIVKTEAGETFVHSGAILMGWKPRMSLALSDVGGALSVRVLPPV